MAHHRDESEQQEQAGAIGGTPMDAGAPGADNRRGEGLTVQAFSDVLASFRSHTDTKKEQAPEEQDDSLLGEGDEERLAAEHPLVDPAVLAQIILVRKSHKGDVRKLLEEYLEFRAKEGWPLKLSEDDIDPRVLVAMPHECARCESGMPKLVFHCKKVDLSIAPASAFQKHAQYLLEQLTWKDEHAQVYGVAVELDLEDAKYSILADMELEDLKRGLGLFRHFPVKVKKVFVVNAGWFARTLIRTVLFFASESVAKVVEFP